jgi:DNA mismatch endonuclease, patch repair protein
MERPSLCRYCAGAMDTRTPEQRSHIMRSVRSRDTGPEMLVRRLSHAMGLRYRLHQKWLPGTPDLVFPKHRAVIFVNGCFWHGHRCPKGRLPKSRLDFWTRKIQRNRQRDAESVRRLRSDEWRVLTIWQCETKNLDRTRTRLANFFHRKPRKKRGQLTLRNVQKLRNE